MARHERPKPLTLLTEGHAPFAMAHLDGIRNSPSTYDAIRDLGDDGDDFGEWAHTAVSVTEVVKAIDIDEDIGGVQQASDVSVVISSDAEGTEVTALHP